MGQAPLMSAWWCDSRFENWSVNMSDRFWLTDVQLAHLECFFPEAHGNARIDERRVLSTIIFINKDDLRWWGAPAF